MCGSLRPGGHAAHPKRLGPPQQDHHRQRQRHGEAELFDQARIDLEEEGERGGVDEHHVHEGRRHHEGAVLELRQRDQNDDQHERQRRRGQRAPQQHEPEKVERGPGEDERRLRRRLVLGPEPYAEGGEVDGDKQREAAGMPPIGAREAVLQVEDGGRHGSGRQPRSCRHFTAASGGHLSVTELSWQGLAPACAPDTRAAERAPSDLQWGNYRAAAAFSTKRPSKVLARSTLAPLSSSSKAKSMSAADFMPAAGMTPVRE
jgi:hypothetical protein